MNDYIPAMAEGYAECRMKLTAKLKNLVSPI